MSSHSIKIDYSEPIPQMIERLKKEHREFETKLNRAQASISTSDEDELPIVAIDSLNQLADPIIRHAVEEEARIMRVIIQRVRNESAESITIMQEHNSVLEFFNDKLDKIVKEKGEPTNNRKARDQIQEFIQNLKVHFVEEEKIVFPLALKADSLMQ